MAKKPSKKAGIEETLDVLEELDRVAALAARYAVADPGKDARDALFRRMAALGKK